MRVVLIHNPSAGDEDHSARDLVRSIEEAGHEVVADVVGRKALRGALREPCDLVVAAGGDGTVNAAAGVVAGTGVPLTVIPLGTANNIATTLGCTGEAAELIARWEGGALRGLDRGVVTRRDKRRPFVEGFGLGVFPETMHAGSEAEAPESAEERLERDLGMFLDAVGAARPAAYTVSADGEDLSGEYLLVEVLNIGAIGANVLLAEDADPGDGALDLVLIGADQRGLLQERIAGVLKGKPSRRRLPSRRVRRVVLTAPDRRYHLDGELLTMNKRRPRHLLEITVEPHALQVLVPPRRR